MENCSILCLIGSSVGALAALNELGVNEFHELQARHHGFSPGAARAKVDSLRKDINQMLAERNALTQVERSAATLQGRAAIDDAEGKVLRDLGDQGLLEFQRFHIDARRLLAFQQSQYFFDFAKYATNALGWEFAVLALHKHDRKWNLKSGVMFLVSGGLTMGGPVASRVIAKGVAQGHKHFLHGTMAEAEAAKVDDLVADKDALDQVCRSAQVPDDAVTALSRANIYGDGSKIFQDELLAVTKERSKAKLTATQNIGAGFYVGASKIASGVTFSIPGFYRQYNVQTALGARVNNIDLFASAVIGLPATTFSMLDTLRIQVQGEINRHKLMAAGMHPSQLISARLAQLDDIERRVKSSAPLNR
jgi:hypothetical protein